MDLKWRYTKDELPEENKDVYAVVKTDDGFEYNAFCNPIKVKPRIMHLEKDVKYQRGWTKSSIERYSIAFWDLDNPSCYYDAKFPSGKGKWLAPNEIDRWIYVDEIFDYLDA